MLPVRYLPATGLLLAGSLLTGCGKKEAPAAAMMMGGTPEVSVLTVKAEPVKLSTELAGRVAASLTAEVRPQVGGIIRERHFTEGSDVQAGDLLYQIDPATYQASFEASKAALAKAEANLVPVQLKAERYSQLRDDDAVSQQDLDDIVASQKLAEAEIASAKANLEAARINLEYTQVTAPISGRIGRALVTEGALVGQGEATHMAVIQQIDSLYVNFTQSANELLALQRSFAAGRASAPDAATAATIRVVMEDGNEYPHPGRLLFSDLTVDPGSGQVMLRAELPNPDKLLLPGLFVRVRIEQALLADAVLLPQQAVVRAASGDTVQVVDGQGKVSPRSVKVVSSQGDHWVITGGLNTGEQVVVDGFQKIRPGVPVKPVPWEPAGGTPRPGTAAPASAGGAAPTARTSPTAAPAPSAQR
ncbi:MAG: efflux RND transporter periplasmic adaptor subunit [Verrucomicrobiae bacterium]|nr:efflux RND transporter periplasmic adaptor subunit [Verrucomicrobiae bacterium]